MRRELIEPHDMGEIADLLFLLLVETHNQRNGCRFEALNAVRIDIGDLRRLAGDAALARLLRSRISNVA